VKKSGHPLFYKMTREEEELHSAKNKDYTGEKGDPLGNFNRVAGILANYPNLSLGDPTVVALTYAMKQLDAALWMLSQGYEGEIEDVDARLRDVGAYMKLARILHRERKNG